MRTFFAILCLFRLYSAAVDLPSLLFEEQKNLHSSTMVQGSGLFSCKQWFYSSEFRILVSYWYNYIFKCFAIGCLFEMINKKIIYASRDSINLRGSLIILLNLPIVYFLQGDKVVEVAQMSFDLVCLELFDYCKKIPEHILSLWKFFHVLFICLLQASQFLRIITFYSTQLPGPNYHCREVKPSQTSLDLFSTLFIRYNINLSF